MRLLNFLSFLLLIGSCSTGSEESIEGPSGPYLGVYPNDSLQMLAPGIISTALTEFNGTFSPDGTLFFYTTEVAGKGFITYTRMDSLGKWTSPEVAPFSGVFSEYDPLFAPDGNRLYFSSERPIPGTSKSTGTNIWYVEPHGDGWSEPVHIPLSGQGDYYSSLTNNGTIYFNIWNTGKILKAVPTDSGYVATELPTTINSRSDVGDPFVSPEEDYLIFRAYYPGGFGRGDLYISFKINEEWTTPENLGAPINSMGHEICPYVTTDGKYFIFASDRLERFPEARDMEGLKAKYQEPDNGNSNLFITSTQFIQEMKAKHLLGHE